MDRAERIEAKPDNVAKDDPIPPEVVETAVRDFDEERTVDEVRKIQEGRGLKLSDFVDELERLIRPRE